VRRTYLVFVKSIGSKLFDGLLRLSLVLKYTYNDVDVRALPLLSPS